MKARILIIITFSVSIWSCNNNHKSDAYGNFEAKEMIISSEANGKLISLNLEEGEEIEKGKLIGIVDTTSLHLQKQQLIAMKNAIKSKVGNIFSQIEVQKQQKKTTLIEKDRLEKLLKDGAATQKQLDDINGHLNLIDKQINSIKTQNSSIINEIESIEWQIESINYAIEKCYIENPIEGTVLEKYIEPFELVNAGKSLYKLANLSQLELRAYITGAQLPHIKLGQKVEVLIDKDESENQILEGVVSWVSNEAEFTPKVIQTKEERVDQVYAIKVLVKNDGRLKIGMPGEINFMQKNQ